MLALLVPRSAFMAFFVFAISASAANTYQNVYGNDLEPCSDDGMAQTGFTRNGYCVETNDDAGSHHICIDLSSTTGGNFCTVTGQSDWCSSENMPCHEDTSQETCAIEHWCVCQWAFASYLEQAGGCNDIQDIVCESINLEAVLAYQQQSGSKYATALDCLVERCNLDVATIKRMAKGSSAGSTIRDALWVIGILTLLSGVGYTLRRRKLERTSMDQNHLLHEGGSVSQRYC